VAVTNGNQLLLTKYAKGRGTVNYALVAGFTEIGETLEETVQREVMEEVGLKVKNIRYYKSQPWSFSSTLLCGFFCEVDGSTEVKLDTDELSLAEWFEKENIPLEDDGVSLTREMIGLFKNSI
jgi:NAD+ diphosphatase